MQTGFVTSKLCPAGKLSKEQYVYIFKFWMSSMKGEGGDVILIIFNQVIKLFCGKPHEITMQSRRSLHVLKHEWLCRWKICSARRLSNINHTVLRCDLVLTEAAHTWYKVNMHPGWSSHKWTALHTCLTTWNYNVFPPLSERVRLDLTSLLYVQINTQVLLFAKIKYTVVVV